MVPSMYLSIYLPRLRFQLLFLLSTVSFFDSSWERLGQLVIQHLCSSRVLLCWCPFDTLLLGRKAALVVHHAILSDFLTSGAVSCLADYRRGGILGGGKARRRRGEEKVGAASNVINLS